MFRAKKDLLIFLELCFGLCNLPVGDETWVSCTPALTDQFIARYLALNKCSHSSTLHQLVHYIISALQLELLL